jgi:hypothetical protein
MPPIRGIGQVRLDPIGGGEQSNERIHVANIPKPGIPTVKTPVDLI